MNRRFVYPITALFLSAFTLSLLGCSNSEFDNKIDASKLPPKPTDGRGPKVMGGAAPAGGGAPESKPAEPAKPMQPGI